MASCTPFAWYYDGQDPKEVYPLLFSSILAFSTGFIAFLSTWKSSRRSELQRKDGYLIVSGGWLVMSCFGCLPYYLSGAVPSITDAFFETLSGYSTTGATILTDIEAMPKGLLFWRSLTQWIGGMGIIVLAVAILPILGIGGMKLFIAEAPGISADKLQPRIKETAKQLWYIYLGLTLLETLMLYLAGMSFYDAINHAMTTMATGGFSTRNASVGAFESPLIRYIIVFFMLCAGTNFTILYFLIARKFRRAFQNGEFLSYISLVGIFCIIVGTSLYFTVDYSVQKSISSSVFQVVSIITTTGYITEDYLGWGSFLSTLFFFLLFTGASAGSTSGGLKIVRILLLLKNTFIGLKKELHPSAIIPLRLNGKNIRNTSLYNVLAFVILYVIVFNLGTLVLSMMGLDLQTSLGASLTCISNVGPGIGEVGPNANFAHLPWLAKWVLCFLMLVGRLELFTVLILFTPYFWKRYF
ncbi:MAG: TrkH family potassium uptake protein [Cytophagales bacterium]|nr:TrkH family potassium uptake protein [Cytophagales bacterium]